MAIQSAVTVGLAFAKEISQGKLAPGAKLRQLERVSGQLSLEKDSYQSARVRSDRQVAYSRHGVRRVAGQLRDEISIGASDALLEGAVGGSWAEMPVVPATIDIDSDGVITASSGGFLNLSYMFPGLVISILIEGEDGDENILCQVVSISDNSDSITVVKVDDFAEPFVAAEGLFVTFTVPGLVLKNGAEDISYAFQTSLPDVDGDVKWLESTGVKVDQVAIDLPPTGLASATYTLRGLNQITRDTPVDATPLAPVPGSLLAAVNGGCFMDGSKVALLTALSLSTANNVAGDPVVGSNFVPKLFDGTLNVSGQMTSYLEDMRFISAFDQEQEMSLAVTLKGDTEGEFLAVILNRIKINSASITADGTGGATVTASFDALLDPASGAMIAFQSSYIPE